jgi:hypothetical protein
MLDKLKAKLIDYLLPGVREEVYRHAMALEAIYDISATSLRLSPIPLYPTIYQEAIANCEALQEDLASGKITIEDRQLSLIEVLKRKEIIIGVKQ